MQFTTTITQKGQITLPKAFRDALGMRPHDSVVLSMSKNSLKVESKKSILDLAGFIKIPKGHSVLEAREAFENNYSRV